MKAKFLLVMLTLLCAAVLAQSQAPIAPSAKSSVVPSLVKFSGTARDLNGNPLSGVVGVTFTLYQSEQGGAALWLETQNAIADKSGHYSVSLGATKTQGIPADLFTSGQAQWLGVQIAGQPEQPRVFLLSVPYALKAGDAETIGGLPPSAFMLAAPAPVVAASSSPVAIPASSGASGDSSAPRPATVTGSGTTNFVPLWTSTTAIGNSVVFQLGTGATATLGINTTTPATTLDVKGAGTIRGILALPAKGTATATAGASSQPLNLVASSFNSGTSAAVNQTFQWKAEPLGNNTATPSGTLNLLFGSGTTAPAETGLKVSSKGLFTFAPSQTFPGTGTITGVTAGTDLTGGGTSGSVTLNLDTTKVPQLASANIFNAGQTVKGNLTLSGTGNGVIFADGTKQTTASSGGGSGTVTSVALAAPSSDFTVSGSPITKAGTLSLGWSVAPTSSNLANAIVKRDSLGNFNTNTVTASSVIGTLVTATTLTASTVNATNINPSGTVTVNTPNISALVGNSSALNATAISGRASATSGAGWGVAGFVDSGDGTAKGTYGAALASSGTGEGVNGVSLSPFGLGVVGQGGSNIFSTTATSNIGNLPIGVLGDTSLPNAVGVFATTDNGYALVAINNDPFYNAAYFNNAADGPVLAAAGSINGVFIDAGGNLFADGSITGSVKNFRIDHPLDPANKFLNHASIESSELLNLYTGNAVLDGAGSASVTLPEWFTALNQDFRYQLTPIGGFAQLYIAEEVTGNQFRIAGGRAGLKVSWQITGVRHDAYAKSHPLVVEAAKQGEERGHYLHPDAFGQPKEMSITVARRAKMLPQRSGKVASGTPKNPRGF